MVILYKNFNDLKIKKLLKNDLEDDVIEHGIMGVECYAQCKHVISVVGSKPTDYYQYDYDNLMVCSLDKILIGCDGQCDNFEEPE